MLFPFEALIDTQWFLCIEDHSLKRCRIDIYSLRNSLFSKVQRLRKILENRLFKKYSAKISCWGKDLCFQCGATILTHSRNSGVPTRCVRSTYTPLLWVCTHDSAWLHMRVHHQYTRACGALLITTLGEEVELMDGWANQAPLDKLTFCIHRQV